MSGLGHDAFFPANTPLNSPTVVTGMIQQAYQLDGAGDYIACPAGVFDDGSGVPTNDFTFATWVYWNGGHRFYGALHVPFARYWERHAKFLHDHRRV